MRRLFLRVTPILLMRLPRVVRLALAYSLPGLLVLQELAVTSGALAEPPANSAGKASLEASNQKSAQKMPPNIIIILLDDAGYAQADTFGGEIHTPTMTRIANSGIRYNAFHATAISSATRASLLTGRNHHRVGNGTVTEMAAPFDGYTGVIPATAATIPQLLHTLNYETAAFGKWHNTPGEEITPNGPFDHFPTHYGFDHFYGFLGGETDQYHPELFDDTRPIEVPAKPGYHLTEDLADKAIAWLDQQHNEHPDHPFFLYWAPGGVHAPHQVGKEWSNKYHGKFDDGWDAYRKRVFERQKALGWIPVDAGTTPRPTEMPAWDSLGSAEKSFHAREMEVFAGFLEHTDVQAGRLIDEIERLNIRDNTLIFYVFSDNGASAEGMTGTISFKTGTRGWPGTAEENIAALNRDYGGLEALGGPTVQEHYAAAWAWASESPFYGTKLMAGYFGGTRVPLAISWPGQIKPDAQPRPQFHHVNDIAATIYDIVGLMPPANFQGVRQDPLDGVSMVYSFGDAKSPTKKPNQYFEIMGSRAEYQDGWIASVEGPRKPWTSDTAQLLSIAGKASIFLRQPWIGDKFGFMKWQPDRDHWALYDLAHDFSQVHDVAAQFPDRLAKLKAQFDADAQNNNVNPIGASFYAAFHPDAHEGNRKDWHLTSADMRLSQGSAPNIRSRDHKMRIDLDIPNHPSGVIFAVGGVSGGITLYTDNETLVYEYNSYGLTRTKIKIPPPNGHAIIDIELKVKGRLPPAAGEIVISVNDRKVASAVVPAIAFRPFADTTTFDVGMDLGSPVSLDYFNKAPFAFNGHINDVHIHYLD